MMKRKKGNDRKERKKGRKERDEKEEERDRDVNREAFFHFLFSSLSSERKPSTHSVTTSTTTRIHHSSSYVLCQENDHYFLI